MLLICSKCKVSKDSSFYYKRKASKSGFQTYCIACTKNRNVLYGETWRKNNNDKIKKLNIKYYVENSNKLKTKMSEYHIKNRKERCEYKKTHYILNKSLYLHYSRFRKLKLAKATPSWLSTDQLDEIKSYYQTAKKLSEQTFILHHVDHIVPINGKNVCGLHVPWNLQVLPAIDNLKKSNKYDGNK